VSVHRKHGNAGGEEGKEGVSTENTENTENQNLRIMGPLILATAIFDEAIGAIILSVH
jgi:hypothetical protein